MGGRMSVGACGSPGGSVPKTTGGSREAVTLEVPRSVYFRMTATAFKVIPRAARSIEFPHSRSFIPYLPLTALSSRPRRPQVDPESIETGAGSSTQRTAERINEGLLVCGTFDLTFSVTW